MSAPVAMKAVRPSRLQKSTFRVWKLHDRKSSTMHSVSSDTLEGIEAQLAQPCLYGNRFAVKETEAVSTYQTVHFYIIRRCKWQGRYDDFGHKIYPHKADCEMSIPVNYFDPVEHWRCIRDADVIGGDGVINVTAGASA